MRIACIHIPQYALQCATRLDPTLRGAAVAMVAQGSGIGPLHAPIVVACSRAAWTLGVRLGMTAASARKISSSLAVVNVETQLERETVRALAEALLALTGVVDAGGRVGVGGAHFALYAEVPARTRGNAFGVRVLERLAELGLTGRVGIADDRFTAWVAAAYGVAGQRLGDHGGTAHEPGHNDVITVARGGSAAFLAPRPLSLLAIAPEVQHMLEVLGVRTLGEFAALPAPSVARPLEADYQALARGDSGTRLRPYSPEAALREEIIVRGGNVLDGDGVIGGPTAIALLARRMALRLVGRGRFAQKLEVAVTAVGGGSTTERSIVLAAPIDDPDELARLLLPILDSVPASCLPGTAAAPAREPWRLRVIVTGEAVDRGDLVPAEVAFASHMPRLADPLALLLATPGTLFSLSAPEVAGAGLERAHRRTRRGKQRRLRPGAALGLFDHIGG